MAFKTGGLILVAAFGTLFVARCSDQKSGSSGSGSQSGSIGAQSGGGPSAAIDAQSARTDAGGQSGASGAQSGETDGGGHSGASGAQSGGSGSVGSSGCARAPSKVTDNRPVAAACNPTNPSSAPGAAEAGAINCTRDIDCQGDSGPLRWCRNNVCTVDQCLSDTDCGSGEVCGCSNQFSGYRFHANTCVATDCHVDADCGVNGLCSPKVDINMWCMTFKGYHCRSAADECVTGADCNPSSSCGTSGATDSFYWACTYGPGHWACQGILGMATCP
ncbi:MAG TPA: hypothetical protein VGY54_18950 [Polyangiaceae bacterium]|nr:hypothetical protein [Polyangiaceae bacterium]